MRSNITFEERQQLYKELSAFTNERISTMPNNGSVEIHQFEKCELSGAWYYCPLRGVMNADFYDVDRQLTRLYGNGARVKPEVRGDGEGYIATILVNTNNWKKSGTAYDSKRGSNRPAFQTLIIYFLLLLVLSGALYWKVRISH